MVSVVVMEQDIEKTFTEWSMEIGGKVNGETPDEDDHDFEMYLDHLLESSAHIHEDVEEFEKVLTCKLEEGGKAILMLGNKNYLKVKDLDENPRVDFECQVPKTKKTSPETRLTPEEVSIDVEFVDQKEMRITRELRIGEGKELMGEGSGPPPENAMLRIYPTEAER